jgi:hypothetical protein
MSFTPSEYAASQYQDPPNNDYLTRRLKKLVYLVGKNEFQFSLKFDLPPWSTEPSGLLLGLK